MPEAGGNGDRSPPGRGYRALLEAVPRVIARVGFRGLTHREVAREANVTYGLVSYHFGSREALIREAAGHALQRALDRSELVPASGEVRDFAAGLKDLLAADPESQAFQYELALEARRATEMLPGVRAMYMRYFKEVEDAIAELGLAQDPALARVLFAALDGIVLQQLIFDDPKATDDCVAKLQDLLEILRARAGSTAPAE
jgi:AcrR family transcriptional regulator